MRKLLILFVAVGAITFLTSCATRVTVIDSQDDVVRLGPNVRGKVYVWKDGQWTLTKTVKLPEGWYAGPGPK